MQNDITDENANMYSILWLYLLKLDPANYDLKQSVTNNP